MLLTGPGSGAAFAPQRGAPLADIDASSVGESISDSNVRGQQFVQAQGEDPNAIPQVFSNSAMV